MEFNVCGNMGAINGSRRVVKVRSVSVVVGDARGSGSIIGWKLYDLNLQDK
jgi:hypothetical protein